MNDDATGFYSHFPILAGVAAKSSGMIFELGCGMGSTPMLHYIARSMGRRLHSVDTDAAWLERFDGYHQGDHTFEVVSDWRGWMTSDIANFGDVGLVFVDCAPGEMRVPLIRFFANRARFIVAHDYADPETASAYGWKELNGVFRHISVFKRLPPHTAIYSNFERFHVEACDEA